ncbi:hypothetical protein D3C73_1230780 [compost metagenome]
MVTIKFAVGIFLHIGCFPFIVYIAISKWFGCMFGIFYIHAHAGFNVELHFANQNTIHHNLITRLHILHKKLVLRRNFFLRNVSISFMCYCGALW